MLFSGAPLPISEEGFKRGNPCDNAKAKETALIHYQEEKMKENQSCALGSAIIAKIWSITHVEMFDMKYKNIIGCQIRQLRNGLKLSQSQLAARLQIAGLDIDRSRLSKIESRVVYVSDYEQVFLAKVLNVSVEDLYPESIWNVKSRLWEVITEKLRRDPSTFISRKRMNRR